MTHTSDNNPFKRNSTDRGSQKGGRVLTWSRWVGCSSPTDVRERAVRFLTLGIELTVGVDEQALVTKLTVGEGSGREGEMAQHRKESQEVVMHLGTNNQERKT